MPRQSGKSPLFQEGTLNKFMSDFRDQLCRVRDTFNKNPGMAPQDPI